MRFDDSSSSTVIKAAEARKPRFRAPKSASETTGKTLEENGYSVIAGCQNETRHKGSSLANLTYQGDKKSKQAELLKADKKGL
jgi:hypothetical protein